MRSDFHQHLIRDGATASYAVYELGAKAPPQLLLHPGDDETGIRYSLIPMTQSIIGGLFTAEARRHYRLLHNHLLFPDGARLTDRPVNIVEAPRHFSSEPSRPLLSASCMCIRIFAMTEAAAVLGDADALWEALQIANPISIADRLPNAALRQRNTYFSSSGTAFADRYVAEKEWLRVRDGSVAVEGGWRTYSSGPGLYLNMVVQRLFGLRRRFGQPTEERCAPPSEENIQLVLRGAGRSVKARRLPAARRKAP